MRICNYKRAGLVLSLLFFFHVKSLAASYYRLKSTKPLFAGSKVVRQRYRNEERKRKGRKERREGYKVGRGGKGDPQLRTGHTRGTLITGLA